MLPTKELEKVQKSFGDGSSRLALIFSVLGDPTRLKVFQLLSQRKDLCVTDVANVFEMSVPAASYQLKTLEMVGLVKRERMGKMICYCLNADDSLVKTIMKIIQ